MTNRATLTMPAPTRAGGRGLLFAAAALTLLPASAVAQTDAIQKQVEQKLQRWRMYEDIEIMRRLLHRKLVAAVRTCQACHSVGWDEGVGGTGMTGGGEGMMGSGFGGSFGGGLAGGGGMPGMGMGGMGMAPGPGGGRAEPRDGITVEGLYLPGHGAVFQVQVPALLLSHQNAAPAPKPAPPPSDWDLVRRQLRGEQLEAATPHTARHHEFNIDLVQLLLDMLAENGKHFRALGDKEKLTVALTFRGVESLPMAPLEGKMLWRPMGGAGGPGAPGGAGGAGAPTGPMGAGSEPGGGGGPGGGASSRLNTSKDHELLADLHLKQARYDDAARALLKAIALNTDAERVSALQRKLAIAYLMQDQYQRPDSDAVAKAFEAFKKAVEGKKDAPTVRPLTLPERLIVSAVRPTLVGSLSPSEFRRQATVEWLRFGQAPGEGTSGASGETPSAMP